MNACSTLFLCPFKAEAQLLTAVLPGVKLQSSCHWQFNGGEIFTWNAAGPKRMLTALSSLKNLPDFSNLVLFGCAGALDPTLQIGQLFSASSVEFDQQKIMLNPATGLAAAGVVCAKEPVTEAEERLRLFSSSGASIVDMESFFFVHFVQKFLPTGRNIFVIRFVSDTASTPFKLPFVQVIHQQIRQHKNLLQIEKKN